jgi:hypothetical protein
VIFVVNVAFELVTFVIEEIKTCLGGGGVKVCIK